MRVDYLYFVLVNILVGDANTSLRSAAVVKNMIVFGYHNGPGIGRIGQYYDCYHRDPEGPTNNR